METESLIDRDAGVWICDRRNVGNGATCAARIGLPAGLRDVGAAATAGAAPDRLAPATSVACPSESRSTDRGHVLRCGGELDAIAIVAGADGNGDTRVVEVRFIVDFARVFAAAVRVRDHGRSERCGAVDRCC